MIALNSGALFVYFVDLLVAATIVYSTIAGSQVAADMPRPDGGPGKICRSRRAVS